MMYKPFFSALLFLFAYCNLQAQDSLATEKTYPLVIQFQSVCCGVPDEAPLIKAIRAFRKAYKIRKINADKIGPMGREGEYYLAFTLKELNRKQKQLFIRKMEKTVPLLKDKGQASLEKNLTLRSADLPARVQVEKLKF